MRLVKKQKTMGALSAASDWDAYVASARDVQPGFYPTVGVPTPSNKEVTWFSTCASIAPRKPLPRVIRFGRVSLVIGRGADAWAAGNRWHEFSTWLLSPSFGVAFR